MLSTTHNLNESQFPSEWSNSSGLTYELFDSSSSVRSIDAWFDYSTTEACDSSDSEPDSTHAEQVFNEAVENLRRQQSNQPSTTIYRDVSQGSVNQNNSIRRLHLSINTATINREHLRWSCCMARNAACIAAQKARHAAAYVRSMNTTQTHWY